MIGVYDTGIGIERQHLDAIFDPYYQVPVGARRDNVGIGLGLSIVSRVAHMLSLDRIVRSQPGKGSLFAVIVPYGAAAARSGHDGQLTDTIGAKRRKQVDYSTDCP